MAKITYQSLFDTLISNPAHSVKTCSDKDTVTFLRDHIFSTHNLDVTNENLSTEIYQKVLRFCAKLKKKFLQCKKSLDDFRRAESIWLSTELSWATQGQTKEADTNKPSTSRGRPRKEFSDIGERAKRRRISEVRSLATAEELYHAAASAAYAEGRRAASELIAAATLYSPLRPVKMRSIIKKANKKSIEKYTEDEALALLLDADLTRDAYVKVRTGAKARGANIYPVYHSVLEAKKRCYPEGMQIDEYGAEIPLQSLLDHTCRRILETLEFPEEPDFFGQFTEILLVCKWGCDGSSSHKQFMQQFPQGTSTEEDSEREEGEHREHEEREEEGEEEGHEEQSPYKFSEKHLFLFSMVPLKLIGIDKDGTTRTVFWENPKPSSVTFCRPIKFKYIQENRDSTLKEVGATESEVNALTPYATLINGTDVAIKYVMVFTMLDTKVISTLTGTASASCYLCGCKPTDMNNLQKVSKLVIYEERLRFGLSTLHAWIKFLECVLHISYKLDLRKTSLRGASAEAKAGVKTRQRDVQEKLWQDLGLKVDRVVQGCGTSNTGNVARRFFSDSNTAAKATGVDERLIHRFHVILQVLASGQTIDEDAFDRYAQETAQLYVSLYSWYYMPPTVHKILIHGSSAVKYAVVPIGTLSEEAQECRNKDYRRIRAHHSRKTARLDTTTDLLHTLLASSDPVISSLRKVKSASRELHADAKALLKVVRQVPEDPFESDYDEE